MLKSFIDPKKIIGTGTGAANPEAFSNFMLGNSPAVNDAEGNFPSNNITNFSRESGVNAANSNLQSIIKSISENITNNFNNNLENIKSEIKTTNEIVQSQIQNISNNIIQNVNNIIDNKITSLKTEITYQIENSSKSNISSVNNVENNKVTENQIENISTNIIKNTQTSVSNIINSSKTEIQKVTEGIQSQVQTTLTNLIQNFTKDYQQKIQSKEDNKPSNVLKGFLSLYQNAINFVTFFGDSKNNKRIEKSLKSLRNMFNDSFNTALIIRQTIVKIVKQLSNLPTASGTSGGLNLDVKVPGGPLKQVGGSTIGKFVKGGTGRLLGAGVAGAGLGLMGMQAAKASQEEKLAGTKKRGVGEESNGFMEGLNNIVERFSEAIDSLLGGGKKISGGGGGASSGGGGSAGAGAAGAGAAGAAGAAGEINTTGAKGVLDLIASVEQGATGYDSFNQSAGKTSGKATEKTIGWLAKNAQGAIGKYQHMPIYILDRAKAAGYNENTLFTPEVQDAITIQQLRTEHNLDSFLSGTMSAEQFQTKLATTWRGLPQGEANARKLGGTSNLTYQDKDAGRNAAGMTSAEELEKLRKIQSGSNTQIESAAKKPPSTVTPQSAQKPASTAKPAVPSASKVEPSPRKLEAEKVSQAVTTPPGQDDDKNVQVATASLPPDITVIPGGGSQDGGGAVASLPPPSFDKPDVSMYGESANPNNPYWSLPFRLGILNA